MNFKRTDINKKITHLDLNNLDDFEKDALEGWKNLNKKDLMRLDQRYFEASNSLLKIGLRALFFLTFLVSVFLHQRQHETKTEIKKPNISNGFKDTVKMEFIPIKLPNTTIQLIAKNEQISPIKIQNDLKSKRRKVENETEIESTEERKVSIAIKTNPISKISPVQIQNLAKEMYLQDLLVVDYRYYRKKDPIKLNPQLTGTPANESIKSREENSKEELEVSYVNFLSKSLQLFNKKLFQEAIYNFEIILSKYPNDLNALFYEAIALYNLGLNKEAIRRLNQLQIASFTNFDEDQKWYLLLCYKAERNVEQFNLVRNQIIKSKGYYWMRAQQLEF